MTLTLQNTLKRKTEILIRMMKDDGIEKNCHDYGQYIKAKKVVESLASSPCEFEALVRIVTDYIGI
jgi:hypothetical protein